MSVRLRLQRHGANKRPFYRVVAADKRAPRDGSYIELLGTYDPLQDPGFLRLKSERIDYWLGVGAQPSDTVKALIKRLNAGDANTTDLSKEDADKKALKARMEAKKQNISNARAAAATEHAEAAKKASEVKAAEAKAKEEEVKAAAEAKAAEEKAAAPKEEAPKEDTPKEEALKEEAPKEEAPEASIDTADKE